MPAERGRVWLLPVGVAVAVATAAVLAAPPGAPAGRDGAASSPTAARSTGPRPATGATAVADVTAVASRPPVTESGIAIPHVGTAPARLDQQDTATAPPPTAIAIPTLDVSAPVVPVGVVAATGDMVVPPDARTAAWYRHGPTPGQAGSAVIAAHVDYDGVRGLFYALEQLRPGDAVEVTLADGAVKRFRVTEVETYLKEDLPTEQLFARSGDPVLTLITCGGRFDPATRSYASNVVVRAVPA